MSLELLIKEKIRTGGAINIEEYMSLALTHPEYGYYMKRDPLGKEGDFVTSPEISQIFGEIIGGWLAHNWQLLGSPAEVALVELGAGRGTLMADILRATKNISGFHAAISVHIIEVSPTLRQKQWKTLAGKHERIEWHDDIDSLPQLPLLLVANEFFDALPIRQFIKEPDGWHERMIGIEDGELAFITSASALIPPISIMPANSMLEDLGDILVAEQNDAWRSSTKEQIIETCEPAIMIVRQISEHIAKNSGAALIIDYGYTQGSNGDTLQAIRYHAYHPVLNHIGDADLTAHVDFLALTQAAQSESVNVHGIVPQGAFLMRLGAGERTTTLCKVSNHEQQQSLISALNRLASPTEMGELFKVMAITSKQIEKAEGF